jgi:hypothetical protein
MVPLDPASLFFFCILSPKTRGRGMEPVVDPSSSLLTLGDVRHPRWARRGRRSPQHRQSPQERSQGFSHSALQTPESHHWTGENVLGR